MLSSWPSWVAAMFIVCYVPVVVACVLLVRLLERRERARMPDPSAPAPGSGLRLRVAVVVLLVFALVIAVIVTLSGLLLLGWGARC